MWRIWQQALRLTSGAIICSVVCFVPHAARSQDVLVIPESGQQQTGAELPTASPPPSANETSAALPPDIGDLLYPQPQLPMGEKRYVTPIPPVAAVAGLPMYQKQLEMRVPEEQPVVDEKKNNPVERTVSGFLSPLVADGLTSDQEDLELQRIVEVINQLQNENQISTGDYGLFREYMRRHPNSSWNKSIELNLRNFK